MSERNKDLARRWFLEVWNENTMDLVEELLKPHSVGHLEEGKLYGKEPFLEMRSQYLAALPDLKFTVEDTVADADDVVVRWRVEGTHTGEGLGCSPTQQPVTVTGMSWYRFKDGVMTDAWDGWNREGFMRTLRGDGQGSNESSEPADSPTGSLPADVRLKLEIAERIGVVREELFGDHGGPDVARKLNIPVRTWYNYESGVAIPGEVLLRFIELTHVRPAWLLRGEEPRYESGSSSAKQL